MSNKKHMQKTTKQDSQKKNELETQSSFEVHKNCKVQDRLITHTGIDTKNLIELVVERSNMRKAYQKVVRNKGKGWIDKMEVKELFEFLKWNWESIKEKILEGKYKPMPVRRVEIPKANGKKRGLWIPTVVDRTIQQAILQIMEQIYEPEFSESSYGFRPNKGAQQAIQQAKKYVDEGLEYVVDMDLEKFFDKVNHDKLIGILEKKIKDKKLIKLIKSYLKAWVMINGVVTGNEEWTPQGWPLSPLLANIVLNEMDKELEKRGHKFCRYADDCNIFLKSRRAAERVMQSITIFVEKKLKLKVNKEKSKVDKVEERQFLGFTIERSRDGEICIVPSTKAKKKLFEKLKELTKKNMSISLDERIKKLNVFMKWWIGYYWISKMKEFLEKVSGWIRRRLRMCIWKTWKEVKTRYKNLRKLGLSYRNAISFANTRKGVIRIALSAVLQRTLTNKYFKEIWLCNIVNWYQYRSNL